MAVLYCYMKQTPGSVDEKDTVQIYSRQHWHHGKAEQAASREKACTTNTFTEQALLWNI